MSVRKLIEVALPLETINRESAREKSIRRGHPSTLHLWWARRPLAAARAILFAQLVDDPSSHPDRFPTEELQREERARLHKIIESLAVWENGQDQRLLKVLCVVDGDHVGVTDGGDDAVMRTAPLGVVSGAVVVSVTESSPR